MPPLALDWLNLLLRWTHVLAGIMWIGDSLLFMWMDRSLTAPRGQHSGAVVGELWMVHSGGFYEVVKRSRLAPAELPPTLHWFKWQAYATWISGFFLLGVMYYFGNGVFLVDLEHPGLTGPAAIALSLALLVVGWLVYDALWSSPLARRPRAATLISSVLLVGLAFGLTRVFGGRAAFLHFGAILGTIMVANVGRRIIPGQDRMIAATRAGTEVDTSHGARAKTRSIHNHYLTLPVLFTMLSNHFPMLYGHPYNWVVLVLLAVVGASAKYVMNARAGSNRWIVAAGVASLVAVIAMTARPEAGVPGAATLARAPRVPFATAEAIVVRRCLSCHSTHPSNLAFAEPPNGVVFERPEFIQAMAPRLWVRAVATHTMPLGNLTGMTEDERRTLGAWIAQGARIDGTATTSP
jgi:uncharacterized membrane protein